MLKSNKGKQREIIRKTLIVKLEKTMLQKQKIKKSHKMFIIAEE